MEVNIQNEISITIPELIKEANAIWRKVRSAKVSVENYHECTTLLSKMQSEHINFARAYPIVLRFMCELNKYAESAFKQYLVKLKNAPLKTEDDYINSQVDYLVLLFKQTNRGWKPAHVENYRSDMYKILKDEHDDMKKRAQEVSEKVEQLKKERAELEKKVLSEFYAQHKEYMLNLNELNANAIPLSVKTDVLDECPNITLNSNKLDVSQLGIFATVEQQLTAQDLLVD